MAEAAACLSSSAQQMLSAALQRELRVAASASASCAGFGSALINSLDSDAGVDRWLLGVVTCLRRQGPLGQVAQFTEPGNDQGGH
jgi:hypothetical protein